MNKEWGFGMPGILLAEPGLWYGDCLWNASEDNPTRANAAYAESAGPSRVRIIDMSHFVYLLIEFTVQTVFLFVALWIMIKLQKLDYHLLGLLGSAALVSAIDLIPLPFFIAAMISCSVLLVCITKVTASEYVDVLFTVFIGSALTFGMNLWLLGAMLGDLRPSAREAEEALIIQKIEQEENAGATSHSVAAAPAETTAPLKVATTEPRQKAVTTTNAAAKSAVNIVEGFSVRGVTANGSNSSVIIHSGLKTYTLFLRDSVSMQTAAGPVQVSFDELAPPWVVLTIEGQRVKLAL